METQSDGIGTLVPGTLVPALRARQKEVDSKVDGGSPVLFALAEIEAVVNAQGAALDQLQGRLQLVLRYEERDEVAMATEPSAAAGPLDDHLQAIARSASRNLQAIHGLMERLTV